MWTFNLYFLHKQIEETFFWWLNNKKQSAMLKRTNVAKNVVWRLWRFLSTRKWLRRKDLEEKNESCCCRCCCCKKWLQLRRFIQSKKLTSYLQSTKNACSFQLQFVYIYVLWFLCVCYSLFSFYLSLVAYILIRSCLIVGQYGRYFLPSFFALSLPTHLLTNARTLAHVLHTLRGRSDNMWHPRVLEKLSDELFCFYETQISVP